MILPAAVCGIDIEALLSGAAEMEVRCRSNALDSNPAGMVASLLHHADAEEGRSIHVIMPYADRLRSTALWFQQLWAESLGKGTTLSGEDRPTGPTPLAASGATDQHSQVQLYTEGPRDKVVTFIRLDQHDPDIAIPAGFEEQESIAYLGGHSLGELLNMEQRATELALVRSQRPTSVISIETLDAESIGFLFHMFEVQTLVMLMLFYVFLIGPMGIGIALLRRDMLHKRGLGQTGSAWNDADTAAPDLERAKLLS